MLPLLDVADFADRLYVIERGEIIYSGSPVDVRNDPGGRWLRLIAKPCRQG